MKHYSIGDDTSYAKDGKWICKLKDWVDNDGKPHVAMSVTSPFGSIYISRYHSIYRNREKEAVETLKAIKQFIQYNIEDSERENNK